MDEKRYSLNDIFGLLHESTVLLGAKTVKISSGNSTITSTTMSLAEYVAMSVASELTSPTSRMAAEEPMATTETVEAAMANNHWSEISYPRYNHVGLTLGGAKKRKTRRTRR
jgi:hypothetical protein